MADGPKLFVRIIPSSPFEASRTDLVTYHGEGYPLGILGDYSNLWIGTSPAGAVAWNADGQTLRALTQWFQSTGEIWGIWPDVLKDWQGQVAFTDVYSVRGLERFFTGHFATLTRFSTSRPWREIGGARGLDSSVLPGARYARGGRSAMSNAVGHEKIVAAPTETMAREITFAFMRKLYDAYGARNLDEVAYERLLRGS